MNNQNKQDKPKVSLMERFKAANREHPVLMNIVYIIITGVVLVWLLLLFLDSWTRHGDEAVVPALKGQSLELAATALENDGFKWEVMDSVYETTQRPGTVVEQNPGAGARVKPGRTVYMTIVAFSPKMVTVPDYMNVSMRQGRSMFEGLGLKVHVVTVSSQYKDLVLGAKVNGVPLRVGQRIPVTSNVTLEVGGGYDEEEIDDEVSEYLLHDTGSAEENDREALDDEDETVKMLLGE